MSGVDFAEEMNRLLKLLEEQQDLHSPQTRDDNVAADDYDPSPWCHQCGARTEMTCDCGPIAENN